MKLIGDGDVIASLSAAALKCLGGEIQGRFRPRNDGERARLDALGVSVDRVYRTTDLAPGQHLVFSATGITDCDLVRGVKFFKHGARTHTVSMGYRSRVVRFSDAVHLLGDGARVTIQI
ncbi:MAG: fructose-bisphosphatase class II [Trueperaceae bacterium]|nr:fructose-bisphosphatase class II [Trueperaceae bacterium]